MSSTGRSKTYTTGLYDFKHAAVHETNLQSRMVRAMNTESSSFETLFGFSKQAQKYSRHCPHVAA